MSGCVSNWSENIIDHVSKGIALTNIPAFTELMKDSLQLKREENFSKLKEAMEEMSRDCEGSISRFLDYSEGKTKNFAALHCVKDPLDGTLTIAYVIHTITFQMEEGGNAVTELPEDYQKREAEQRLREMGFKSADADQVNELSIYTPATSYAMSVLRSVKGGLEKVLGVVGGWILGSAMVGDGEDGAGAAGFAELLVGGPDCDKMDWSELGSGPGEEQPIQDVAGNAEVAEPQADALSQELLPSPGDRKRSSVPEDTTVVEEEVIVPAATIKGWTPTAGSTQSTINPRSSPATSPCNSPTIPTAVTGPPSSPGSAMVGDGDDGRPTQDEARAAGFPTQDEAGAAGFAEPLVGGPGRELPPSLDDRGGDEMVWVELGSGPGEEQPTQDVAGAAEVAEPQANALSLELPPSPEDRKRSPVQEDAAVVEEEGVEGRKEKRKKTMEADDSTEQETGGQSG